MFVNRPLAVLATCGLSMSVGSASAQDTPVTFDHFAEEKVYSPYVDRTFPDRILWGNTHLHTNLSPDAGLVGTTLGPEEAYRFARGEQVVSSTGKRVALIRPLDWLVVSDHAEYIGLAPMIRQSDPLLLADPYGKWLHERFSAGQEGRMEAFQSILKDAAIGNNRFSSSDATRSIWERFAKIADAYDEPGRFSAFIGFEWSSMPSGNNLHRVVIFRDSAERATQVLPFSLFDSDDPEDLWKYMAGYEAKTGGSVLAIPHNGNLSNGQMFAEETLSGQPIDRAYAEARIRWEPIIEATQIKGDGETHPILSADDEFADFENWDVANLDGSATKEDWMLQYEYARSALKLGLKIGYNVGANPYKFGLSGATDAHTALTTTREENFFGKFKSSEPAPDRLDHMVLPAKDKALTIYSRQEVASGLTGVWARENTRAAIFDAIRRKEVYATTGTRITVRVFAGWDFKADEVQRPDFIDQGYTRGVPMGGDLTNAPRGKAPAFMIRALRDVDGANLDRIQIIKGWLDMRGELHEKVYDVTVSDGRSIGADGRCRTKVGNTVDVAKATYTNSIGDPLLGAHWVDPHFDPNEHAFYYVRVLEIPTPRWTTYDAAFFGIVLPSGVPATLQDRAYTSPIWYTPAE